MLLFSFSFYQFLLLSLFPSSPGTQPTPHFFMRNFHLPKHVYFRLCAPAPHLVFPTVEIHLSPSSITQQLPPPCICYRVRLFPLFCPICTLSLFFCLLRFFFQTALPPRNFTLPFHVRRRTPSSCFPQRSNSLSVVPGPVASESPGYALEMQMRRPHPRTYRLRKSGDGALPSR